MIKLSAVCSVQRGSWEIPWTKVVYTNKSGRDGRTLEFVIKSVNNLLCGDQPPFNVNYLNVQFLNRILYILYIIMSCACIIACACIILIEFKSFATCFIEIRLLNKYTIYCKVSEHQFISSFWKTARKRPWYSSLMKTLQQQLALHIPLNRK